MLELVHCFYYFGVWARVGSHNKYLSALLHFIGEHQGQLEEAIKDQLTDLSKEQKLKLLNKLQDDLQKAKEERAEKMDRGQSW